MKKKLNEAAEPAFEPAGGFLRFGRGDGIQRLIPGGGEKELKLAKPSKAGLLGIQGHLLDTKKVTGFDEKLFPAIDVSLPGNGRGLAAGD